MALQIGGRAGSSVELETLRRARAVRHAAVILGGTAACRANVAEAVGLAGGRTQVTVHRVATAGRVEAGARSRRASGQRLRRCRTAELALGVAKGLGRVARTGLGAPGARPDAAVRDVDAAGVGACRFSRPAGRPRAAGPAGRPRAAGPGERSGPTSRARVVGELRDRAARDAVQRHRDQSAGQVAVDRCHRSFSVHSVGLSLKFLRRPRHYPGHERCAPTDQPRRGSGPARPPDAI